MRAAFGAALAAALFASGGVHAASIERTVWDALHIARADAATARLIDTAAAAPEHDTLRYLGIAARATTRRDARSIDELKQAFIAALERSRAIAPPAVRDDFPEGFDRERLLMALAGALVDVESIDFALDRLEAALPGADQRDHDLLLQVMRVTGGPRALSIIGRKYPFPGGEHFPQGLATARYFPDWEDLKQWSPLIAREERTRAVLEREVVAGCGVKPAVAAYFLAHLPVASPDEEHRTDRALERAARTAEHLCFWTRMLAARALALRAPRTPALWASLGPAATGPGDSYFGAGVARFAFAHHGAAFVAPALQWLALRPHWYVEAEISAQVASLVEGVQRTDYWDIWQPRMSRYNGYPMRAVAPIDARPVIEWLAGQPAESESRWARQHLVATTARGARGATFALWLRMVAPRLRDEGAWWHFQDVAEPAALPALRYWKRGKTGEEARLIARFERDVAWKMEKRYGACCDPTRVCLEKVVAWKGAREVSRRNLEDEQALARWLSDAPWVEAIPDAGRLEVRFEDASGRSAVVRAGDAAPARWQHLYGCWMPLDGIR